jgi:hypothetical protein
MKKNLLFVMCMATSLSAFAQFTPGNLAVYRYGNGTDALANGIRVPVFVDEYNPTTGSKVNTIAIPQTASGANYGLEGLGLTSAGLFEREGYPVLSRDGFTLSIIGHHPNQNGQFVIGTINAAGSVSTNTLVIDTDLGTPSGTPRSAVVEGTSVYFNSFEGGIRYKQLGTSNTSTRVSEGQNSPRVLTISDIVYNNGSTTNTRIFSPIGTDAAIAAKTPLPTVSTSFDLIGYEATGVPTNAHQMAIVNAGTGTNRRTLLYLLDDNAASPKIRKYRLNNGATTWLTLGSIDVPLNTKSLIAKLDGSGVKLYFTSYGDGGSVASGIYTASDNFTGDGNATITATSYTLLATAPANTTFRGVTMAPIANPLPVTLTSFDAKESQNTIKLNWATSSEKNSSHFDVLKSYDGKEFLKIGEVRAAGISDTHTDYSFVDDNPFPGVNYYQLQQFDKNGTATFYGPKQVTSKVQKTDFSIYASASKAAADLFVYSIIRQQGKIRILSIGGQILFDENLALEKGYSKITLPANFIKTGVQVAVLNAQSETITKKFIWQQ